MKLCKDCKHFVPNGSVPLCSHPEQPREPVFGHISALCQTSRGRTTVSPWNKCGEDGKLFEERPPVVEAKPEVNDLAGLGCHIPPVGFLGRARRWFSRCL